MQVSSPAWGKIAVPRSLDDLYTVIPRKNIRVPEHVVQLDEGSKVEETADTGAAAPRTVKDNEAFLEAVGGGGARGSGHSDPRLFVCCRL